ncbi:MAG: hypothetical protein GJU72_07445 [Acidithiobacillus ferriphilus]|jgi:predicted DNA-binding transcriptional regulator AlpA|uniref:hypothetical protein n=1 Tax=Acidithiobacillus ferriphilus TaxID=1689834 RepID=UPI00242A3FF3|nr:hypothetical protein [Acidithiobacillus ferriphilus]MBW9248891.1 hypothetical protein [Acidithiobacillus ferriphilus]MBW9254888.1 hypothetical protein [Acidithiobacillus ferriphilus]
MKSKTQQTQALLGGKRTSAQLYQERKDRESATRMDKKHGIINNMQIWLADMDWKAAHQKPLINKAKVVRMAPRAPHARRGGEGSRSSAASGDGNSDSADPERRQPLQTLDQAALATLLILSKKSVQNIYSKTPWLLPQAISVPGARGPRWTQEAVQEWLEQRPRHTAKPAPKAANKKKVGRPRIALVKQGGAA